ncbi:MAG: hypothetical protein WAX77_16175 [Methylococcaceae bacterium]
MLNTPIRKPAQSIPAPVLMRQSTDNQQIVVKVLHHKNAKNDHCLLHACECMRQK